MAGASPLSADIISSVEHDGPVATAVALFGVLVLVLAIFRRGPETPLVVGSLVLGVLWLVATTVLLKVKVNFCNFIADAASGTISQLASCPSNTTVDGNINNSAIKREIVVLPLVPVTASIRAKGIDCRACKYCFCQCPMR